MQQCSKSDSNYQVIVVKLMSDSNIRTVAPRLEKTYPVIENKVVSTEPSCDTNFNQSAKRKWESRPKAIRNTAFLDDVLNEKIVCHSIQSVRTGSWIIVHIITQGIRDMKIREA